MKIDITRAEGYRKDMTPEEKLKLYESYDVDLSGFVKKDVADRLSSEAAEWKRKYNATLGEQERKAAEEAERYASMEKELTTLRRAQTIDRHTAEYVSLGFSRELAAQTAEAMADGRMDAVFANFAAHQSERDAQLKAELLKTTPTPPPGQPGAGPDYAKMAETAFANGDYAGGTYYTRLSQQQKE